MKREDYPQIDYYSMTKEEWDSIFAMIPWLEKIEKISPEEMYTDHGGTRTRPLKYVEYKSASVQLIGRLFKLLKPFDWANWDEGIDMSALSREEADYVKTAKILLGHTLYSDSWLEL